MSVLPDGHDVISAECAGSSFILARIDKVLISVDTDADNEFADEKIS
jgi:hypothetical protein